MLRRDNPEPDFKWPAAAAHSIAVPAGLRGVLQGKKTIKSAIENKR